MKLRLVLVLVNVGLLVCGAGAWAGSLHLKNGNTLEGAVLEEGDNYRFFAPSGSVLIPKAEVDRAQIDSGTPTITPTRTRTPTITPTLTVTPTSTSTPLPTLTTKYNPFSSSSAGNPALIPGATNPAGQEGGGIVITDSSLHSQEVQEQKEELQQQRNEELAQNRLARGSTLAQTRKKYDKQMQALEPPKKGTRKPAPTTKDRLVGTVQNTSTKIATSVRLAMQLFDDGGAVLDERRFTVQLPGGQLGPSEQADFDIAIDTQGVTRYNITVDNVRWEK